MEIVKEFRGKKLQQQRQTLEIVEDFSSGAKFRHFSFFSRKKFFFSFFWYFFQIYQSLTVDVSSVAGAPKRRGVLMT